MKLYSVANKIRAKYIIKSGNNKLVIVKFFAHDCLAIEA